ncbi:glycosyltransferase [Weeksellaceae bacterium TAE3-ERU29]|nr:glycosyltransferase [Weeksellaceae bacterium TAE3-ERU29]
MNFPKVSIILPVYNVERYISQSIESVIKQNFSNWELLVIIDGSPDNSKEIAKKFVEKDSRIKIYEKENGGLSDARNFGLERARGEYIYFMDSDDWIESNLISDNIKILIEKKLDLVIFGYKADYVDINDNIKKTIEIVPESNIFEKENRNLHITPNLLRLLGFAWNKIYRRDFLNENRLRFDVGISLIEDILFNTRVFCCTNTLSTVNKSYYHYINRESETLVNKYYPNLFDLQIKRHDALIHFFNNWNISTKNKKEILAYNMIGSIKYGINNLYTSKNNLTYKERNVYINVMVNNIRTQDSILDYHPQSFKDIVLKQLIKRKKTRILSLISTIMKYI